MMDKAEVLKKYEDVPLKFASYYKYSFGFRGIAPDGAEIYASVGGDADDIYRFEVRPETERTLCDGYSYAQVTINGEKVWSESSW
jgi:hypothetical protein